MPMNFNELPGYSQAVAKLSEEIAAGADAARQQELFAEAFNTLGEELEAKNASELDRLMDTRLANKTLTAEEIKFFNELKKDVGTKNPKILPETVVEEVFEDLKTNHPLLSVIKFRNTTIRLKVLTAETSGVAIWGPIHAEIAGQLDQTFKEEDFSQNKLTAFIVVPKDAEKFGPTWLKQFITDQIAEQVSVALETAIVSGTGANQPVGLMKDLSKATAENGAVVYKTDKAAVDIKSMTSANALETFVPIMQTLSTKDNGVPVAINGKVKLLVNPVDYFTIDSKFTVKNSLGIHITDAPYGIELIMSVAVPQGTGIAFVPERYEAFMATTSTIEQYDQTFAMEDLDLFVSKSYFYGKPKDNSVAVVLTVADKVAAKKKASSGATG